MAAKNPLLMSVRPDGLEDAPQLQLDIDRDKAGALGVNFAAINTTLSTALGSSYVNDFPNAGRLQRVVVQADAPARMQPDDLLQLNALNTSGQPVPLSAFTTTRWIKGPMQTVRYNGYPAMRISGRASAGSSAVARRWPKWRSWRHSCRRASPMNGPVRRAKRSSPARPR